MHKYTITYLNKNEIIFKISAISIVLSTLLSKLLDKFNITFVSISSATLFVILYNIVRKYLWKSEKLFWLFKTPDINGNWEVQGLSKNDKLNQEFVWKGVMSITQTFDEIVILLKTENSNSSSKSFSCSLSQSNEEEFELDYKYNNSPSNNAMDDMKKHEGSCIIKFNIKEKKAEGSYFNNGRDRATNGTMTLKKVVC